DAHVVANMQLVYRPLRGPGLAAVFVPVQVTHHAFFKTVCPGMAVIAVCATHMDIGVGYGFVQEFDLRPVFLLHVSPSGPCRAGTDFAPVPAKWVFMFGPSSQASTRGSLADVDGGTSLMRFELLGIQAGQKHQALHECSRRAWCVWAGTAGLIRLLEREYPAFRTDLEFPPGSRV